MHLHTQAHNISIFSTITSRNNGTGAAIHLSILGDMYMYVHVYAMKKNINCITILDMWNAI